MQQVRCRMIQPYGLAPVRVDAGRQRLSEPEHSALQAVRDA